MENNRQSFRIGEGKEDIPQDNWQAMNHLWLFHNADWKGAYSLYKQKQGYTAL